MSTSGSVSGAPSDNTTLTEVLTGLAAQGYDSDFFVRPGPVLRCGQCHEDISPDAVRLDHIRRLEGASDPADMCAVLALECPVCGRRGTAVVRYGPEASREDSELLLALPPHPQDQHVD